MSNESVTLSREQWKALWDIADNIRASLDGVSDLLSAFDLVGLTASRSRLEPTHDAVSDMTIAMHRILVAADDAVPPQQGEAA